MREKIFFATMLLWAVCFRVQSQDVWSDAPDTPVVGASLFPTDEYGVAHEDTTTWVGRLQTQLDMLSQSPLMKTSMLGLCVYDLHDQRLLYAHNYYQRMRPASCQKLVTSITALHALGADHQFSTPIYVTGAVVDSVLQGNLYIKGGMDPLLSTDDLYLLADILRVHGIKGIAGNVCLDASAKDDKPYGRGWCWDDEVGPLAALLLNKKAAEGPTVLQCLAGAGILLSPALVYETVPRDARLLTTLQHPLKEVLDPMMKESDNVMAECMLYQIAFRQNRKGAGANDAVVVVNKLLRQLGLVPDIYEVADGSGLSLYNYVTPEMLLTLLNYAHQNRRIYGPLSLSLPIAGIDGTLQKRMTGTSAQGNIYAKTGTVTGVTSLCGYAQGGNGHLLSFCIINQGTRRAAQGREFQDQVCVVLTSQ